MIEGPRYTVSQLSGVTGVTTQKINRCVDFQVLRENVHFERDDNRTRYFSQGAENVLRVYRALDELPLNLIHRECCDAIKNLDFSTLESRMNEGGEALVQCILGNLEQIGRTSAPAAPSVSCHPNGDAVESDGLISTVRGPSSGYSFGMAKTS